MALILDGTSGLSDVDGTAGTPAIRGSDANTGVFFGTDIVGVSTGGTERMRVDASGNVGIGTSSPSTNLHVYGTTDSQIRLQNSSNSHYVGNISGSMEIQSADIIKFLAGGATERARIDSSGNLLVGTTSANGGLFTVNGNMGPATDNARTCANAFYRWSVVYAGTGTINTSDAREKTPVRLLNEAEIAAAQQIASEIGAYKWLSSVAEKGNAAREHLGMTVQRAIEIMEANGLVPFNYGFICYDENEETSRYSFRMDELAMFIARGQQAIITAQQTALESLTARVVALEGQA